MGTEYTEPLQTQLSSDFLGGNAPDSVVFCF